MIFDPEIRDLDVPWPSCWQHRKPSARAEVRKLEWATARAMAEQDVWCDRLEALRQLDLPGDGFDRMFEYDMDRLEAELEAAGAKYPPTWEDQKSWVESQGKEWDWPLEKNHRRSSKIADREISSEVYWLLEHDDHKERIKAYVLFAALLRVDPDSDDTYIAFLFWKTLHLVDVLNEIFGPISSPRNIDQS